MSIKKPTNRRSVNRRPDNKLVTHDGWLAKSASSIVGILLVFSFVVYIFISSFKVSYDGQPIEVRTEIFNTVFMAFYGLITMYSGYLWGASKPQKDALALHMNSNNAADMFINKTRLAIAMEFNTRYGEDWINDSAKLEEFEAVVKMRTESTQQDEQITAAN